jgi:hypothetical protein
MPCPAQTEMKMRSGFTLIMKHIIEKTEAVMKIGSFTIRDFSKGILEKNTIVLKNPPLHSVGLKHTVHRN